MNNYQRDVIVVGSGFGAAVPALRFSENGFNVTVIEKGPSINPYKDFQQTQDPKYLLTYMKNEHGPVVHLNYIEAKGGGSGFYEHVSLRTPSLVFGKTDANGIRHWPGGIDRETLDPYYATAEKMLNVHQIEKGKVPKSGQVFAQIMQHLGYSIDRARYAVKDCKESGYCVTGCVYGAKQSLLLNYLPQAEKAGAEILTGTEVFRIRINPYSSYRYIVYARKGDREMTLHTRYLFLGGGTLGTARLLMQNREELPRLSDQVGKNITFNGSVKQMFRLPDWCRDADMFSGRTIPGVASYQFLESDNFMLIAAKVTPLLLLGAARIYTPGRNSTYWGQEHTDLMKDLRKRIMILAALGYTEPTCRLELKKDGRLDIRSDSEEHLSNFKRKGSRILNHIVTQSGGTPLSFKFIQSTGMPYEGLHFSSSHQLGSCRMAESPERGVVDPNGQVFGYPGMYITDGSAIPSSLIVPPSLTILANAERITDGVLNQIS